MRLVYLWLLTLVTLLSQAPQADAADLRISVVVKELTPKGTASKTLDVRVTIDAGGGSEELTRRKVGRYEFQGKLGSDGLDLFELLIEPEGSYISRSVGIKADRFESVISRSLTLYVTKDGEFTYRYLDEGLRYFKVENFDGALAHFEAAHTASESSRGVRGLTGYVLKLDFNYARALQNACLYLNYDTCKKAIRIFLELERLFAPNRAVFERLGIERGDLSKARADAEQYEKRVKFQRIRELFEAGRYLEAARLAEEGLKEYEATPQPMTAIGLNRDRLLTDAGVAYLMAAEDAEAGKAPVSTVHALLRRAQQHLRKVEAPDADTRQNLSVIERRLARRR